MIFAAILLLLISSPFIAANEAIHFPPLSPPQPKHPKQSEVNFAAGGSLNHMMGFVIALRQKFPFQMIFSYFFRQLYPNIEKHDEHNNNNNFESFSESSLTQESKSAHQNPSYDRQRSELIALNVLSLSKRLIGNILPRSVNKYEILSPISLSSALKIALLGAHGNTYEELLRL